MPGETQTGGLNDRRPMPLTLSRITHLLIDMDGVLFRGRTPLPGASDLLPWLDSRQVAYQLITNNSTTTPQENTRLLAGMGIAVSPDRIFTSASAAAAYLHNLELSRPRALVIGEKGLVEALENVGVEIISDPNSAQWVVAGLDRNVTYDKLRAACFAIERGAKFLATNADTSLPVEEGEAPGAGALQAAITATTGTRPVVVGKPEPLLLTLGMQRIGGTEADTAMLGDRLDTDIEAAHRAGIGSILVLTGVTGQADLAGSKIRPSLTFQGLPELLEAWDREYEASGGSPA